MNVNGFRGTRIEFFPPPKSQCSGRSGTGASSLALWKVVIREWGRECSPRGRKGNIKDGVAQWFDSSLTTSYIRWAERVLVPGSCTLELGGGPGDP